MKHWEPRVVSSRQATGRAYQWNRRRRRRGHSRWRIGAGKARLTVLGGLFAGLVAALAWPDANGGMAPQGFGTLPSEGRGQPALVRMIDGDTFDHGGVRVRIADIDTPEVDGRCPYETRLAAQATRRMRTLLTAGPFELHRTPDGRDEDRYGRKLRIVTRDGRSLGDQLVAEGLARTWTGRREPWC